MTIRTIRSLEQARALFRLLLVGVGLLAAGLFTLSIGQPADGARLQPAAVGSSALLGASLPSAVRHGVVAGAAEAADGAWVAAVGAPLEAVVDGPLDLEATLAVGGPAVKAGAHRSGLASADPSEDRQAGTEGFAAGKDALAAACTPPAVTAQPGAWLITGVQPAYLSVSASGSAPLSYQWYRGSSGSESDLVIAATAPVHIAPASSTSAAYWVKVSNACGSVNSNTAMVTVATDPGCGGTWSWANPLPQGSSLWKIVSTGSRLVAVGYAGTILTSPDGVIWTARVSGRGNTLWGVAWTGSQLVVVGSLGTIVTSPDGVTWTSQSSGTGNMLASVAWTGVQLVAVGAAGTVLTSPDGVTWTSQSSGSVSTLNGVVWTGSSLVAAGAGGTVLTSPDGIAWTPRTSGTANNLQALAWADSQVIAVGAAGTVLTSPTGTTWTTQASGSTRALWSVIWTGWELVTVGDFGTILTSLNGVSWTPAISGTGVWLAGVTWTGSELLAVGYGGTILASADGSSWPSRTLGTPYQLNRVAWAGTRLVAVGDNGTILTSPDGVTWTSRASGRTNWLSAVTWTGSQLVTAGGAGTILTSPDGVVWTARTSGTGNGLRALAWTGSQLVAVGDVGTILTSPDGVSWASGISGTGSTLYGVLWTGSQLVAVGDGGTILTSPDGGGWTSHPSGTAEGLRGLAWTGSQIVATGGAGTILTSPDGMSWTSQTSGTTSLLSGVVWTGARLLAVGGNGAVVASTDGVSWVNHRSGTSNSLGGGVCWTGAALVAVGEAGTILRAQCASTCIQPGITAQPQDRAITRGQAATLSITASGTPPLSFQWYAGSSGNTARPIAGATSASLTTPSLSDTATYWARVSNTCGARDSRTATVSVSGMVRRRVPQQRDFALTSVTPAGPIQAGRSGAATVVASRTGGHSAAIALTLAANAQGITGAGSIAASATSGSITITVPSSVAANTYALILNGMDGTLSRSVAFTLNVSGASVTLPTISVQPADSVVDVGQSASFSVTASGAGTLSYQWKKNGTALSSTNNRTYSTPATSLADDGSEFTVVVTDNAGSIESQGAILGVMGSPSCRLDCELSVPAAGSLSTDIAFHASGTSTGCPGSPAYTWTFGDGSKATTQDTTHRYAAAGSYIWSFKASSGDGSCTRQGTILVGGPNCGAALSLSPTSVSLAAGAAQAFTASNSGQSVTDLAWNLSEGSTGGHVTSDGQYSAPPVAGTYHLLAVRRSNPTQCASATITVTDPTTVTDTKSGTITSAGGSLTMNNGMILEIPAGGVPSSTSITLNQLSGDPQFSAPHQTVLRLTTSQALSSAFLKVPISDGKRGDRFAAAYFAPGSSSAQYLVGSVVGSNFVVDLARAQTAMQGEGFAEAMAATPSGTLVVEADKGGGTVTQTTYTIQMPYFDQSTSGACWAAVWLAEIHGYKPDTSINGVYELLRVTGLEKNGGFSGDVVRTWWASSWFRTWTETFTGTTFEKKTWLSYNNWVDYIIGKLDQGIPVMANMIIHQGLFLGYEINNVSGTRSLIYHDPNNNGIMFMFPRFPYQKLTTDQLYAQFMGSQNWVARNLNYFVTWAATSATPAVERNLTTIHLPDSLPIPSQALFLSANESEGLGFARKRAMVDFVNWDHTVEGGLAHSDVEVPASFTHMVLSKLPIWNMSQAGPSNVRIQTSVYRVSQDGSWLSPAVYQSDWLNQTVPVFSDSNPEQSRYRYSHVASASDFFYKIPLEESKLVTKVELQTSAGAPLGRVDAKWTLGTPRINYANPMTVAQLDLIEIQGIGFGDTQGAGSVYFYNGSTVKLPAVYYDEWTDRRIRCRVPVGAKQGPIQVEVTRSGKKFLSNEFPMTALITTPVTNITRTTATGGGNVLFDGGFPVTARGVCWSVSANPTTSNSHTTDGSGTGVFKSNLNDLAYGTLYYVRAYATNSAGTMYGDVVSFTTSSSAGTATLGDLEFVHDPIDLVGEYNQYTIKSTVTDGGINIVQKSNYYDDTFSVRITWNRPPSGSFEVIDNALFWKLNLKLQFETIGAGNYVYTPRIVLTGLATDQGAHGIYQDWNNPLEPNFCLELARDEFQFAAGKVTKASISKSYDVLLKVGCGGAPLGYDGEIKLPIYIYDFFGKQVATVIKYYYLRD